MRFGCCGCMVVGRSPEQEERVVTGIEVLAEMESIGFDYIELSLSDVMKLDTTGFSSLKQRLEDSSVKCEACHNFIPSNIRLTGPDADLTAACEYVRKAFRRAAQLGAKVVVFGSSGARNIPPGYPYSSARNQIVELLGRIGDQGEQHDLTVAVEALNRRESNIINTIGEALSFSRELNHPRIKLVFDYYHMLVENEDSKIILEAGEQIRHVHISEPERRGFPVEDTQSYNEHFQRLKDIGYQGRVSIEAYTEDFETDAARSLELLRCITGS
jgi:D-psicose/D-tagatose/L-ribulose 3-epimerase